MNFSLLMDELKGSNNRLDGIQDLTLIKAAFLAALQNVLNLGTKGHKASLIEETSWEGQWRDEVRA